MKRLPRTSFSQLTEDHNPYLLFLEESSDSDVNTADSDLADPEDLEDILNLPSDVKEFACFLRDAQDWLDKKLSNT